MQVAALRWKAHLTDDEPPELAFLPWLRRARLWRRL